jgi:hypothetical protein
MPDAWSLAFQTNVPDEVAGQLNAEHVAVFIPTTPSPVNGFYFYVRRDAVIELDMSVDAALKAIVSMGVVATPMKPEHRQLRRATDFNLRIFQHAYPLLRRRQRRPHRPDRQPVRLGPSPARPWRRDLHRPARPEGTVQVVIDPDTPEAFKLAEDTRRIRPARGRQGARPSRRHRESRTCPPA